jgi:hypothetical protein
MNSQFSREGGYQPWTSDMAVMSGSLELGDFSRGELWDQWSSDGVFVETQTALGAIPMTTSIVSGRCRSLWIGIIP